MNEQHLIVVMMNNARQLGPAANQIARRELTLKYGVLQMVAVTAHGLEDLAQPLVVGDVVTNQIRLPHILWGKRYYLNRFPGIMKRFSQNS